MNFSKKININSCWGDPHCSTFDNMKFDFMGACKYDFVSTTCFNETLPSDLVAFNITQKQETLNNPNGVAFIEYIEVNVFGNQYRLLKKKHNKHQFSVNGVIKPVPFNDNKNGLKVYVRGQYLVFNADFGLTVRFDGVHRDDVKLSDKYAHHVCGLCGNADGK